MRLLDTKFYYMPSIICGAFLDTQELLTWPGIKLYGPFGLLTQTFFSQLLPTHPMDERRLKQTVDYLNAFLAQVSVRLLRDQVSTSREDVLSELRPI
jgi:hypothetical protein